MRDDFVKGLPAIDPGPPAARTGMCKPNNTIPVAPLILLPEDKAKKAASNDSDTDYPFGSDIPRFNKRSPSTETGDNDDASIGKASKKHESSFDLESFLGNNAGLLAMLALAGVALYIYQDGKKQQRTVIPATTFYGYPAYTGYGVNPSYGLPAVTPVQ